MHRNHRHLLVGLCLCAVLAFGFAQRRSPSAIVPVVGVGAPLTLEFATRDELSVPVSWTAPATMTVTSVFDPLGLSRRVSAASGSDARSITLEVE